MITVRSKLRKWGNSFGVVVPVEEVEKANLHVGDEVTLLVKQGEQPLLKKMFGTHKTKQSTEQIMKEIDRELYDDE